MDLVLLEHCGCTKSCRWCRHVEMDILHVFGWPHLFSSVKIQYPTALWVSVAHIIHRTGKNLPTFTIKINYTSSARTSRGRKFQRKTTISQRKNLPIECAQGDRPARCPNHFFAVNEPSAVPWWWCDLFWCHEVACGVRWSNVLGCEVTWGELLWLVATWHVMLCHLMCWSCHLVRCAGHVMSLDELQSITPYYKVQLCTTKYYSSTTLYY